MGGSRVRGTSHARHCLSHSSFFSFFPLHGPPSGPRHHRDGRNRSSDDDGRIETEMVPLVAAVTPSSIPFSHGLAHSSFMFTANAAHDCENRWLSFTAALEEPIGGAISLSLPFFFPMRCPPFPLFWGQLLRVDRLDRVKWMYYAKIRLAATTAGVPFSSLSPPFFYHRSGFFSLLPLPPLSLYRIKARKSGRDCRCGAPISLRTR